MVQGFTGNATDLHAQNGSTGVNKDVPAGLIQSLSKVFPEKSGNLLLRQQGFDSVTQCCALGRHQIEIDRNRAGAVVTKRDACKSRCSFIDRRKEEIRLSFELSWRRS